MIIYLTAMLVSVFFAYFADKTRGTKNDDEINVITETETEAEAENETKIKTKTKTYNKFLQVISFLPLFLVASFRYGIGVDYGLYSNVFQLMTRGVVYSYYKSELIFIEFNRILATFTSNEIYVFIISSLVICGFIYIAIYQQSESPYLSIILFVISTSYFISLNIVRESIVIALLMYAIKFIKNNKPIHYFIITAICIGIHSMAIIMIPIYFIVKVKINPIKMIIAIILVAIFSRFTNSFLYKAISLTRFVDYYSIERWETAKFQITQTIINSSFLLLYFANYKQYKDDKQFIIYYNLQFLAVIACIFSAYVPLMYRIINLFTFLPIIEVPSLIRHIHNDIRVRSIITMVVFGACFGFMILDIVVKGNQGVLPYVSVFGR
ncbi:MAG: EpsG family protein [Bacillota bacterium]|nr:EpsG family protein [Bacillota bacterium]